MNEKIRVGTPCIVTSDSGCSGFIGRFLRYEEPYYSVVIDSYGMTCSAPSWKVKAIDTVGDFHRLEEEERTARREGVLLYSGKIKI